MKKDKKLIDLIPLELHGHRKKTTFFLNTIKDYLRDNKLNDNEISILEIGCSNGSLVTLPLADQGYNILGIDLHKPSIDVANKNNTYSNACFECKDLADFDTSETFNIIILSDILEHVENPDFLLKMSKKHLIDNGIILVSVPNGYGPSELERRFLETTKIMNLINYFTWLIARLIGRKSVAYNSDSGHIQFFKMKDLKNLYNASELEIKSFNKGALFGGGITYPLGKILPFIIKPSLNLADKINSNFVSTWYFCLKRSNR